MAEQIETVIIGAGQSGLGLSYCLTQLGREHVILERGGIAERWRSERWDSLTLLTPNWMTRLPGYAYSGDDPEGFAPRDEVVQFLEGYADSFKAPVRFGARVTSLQQKAGGNGYLVQVDGSTIEAGNVVIATGPHGVPKIPPVSTDIPTEIAQIHSSRYRNPQQLPSGAVLVVGAAASGQQIAEELYQSGRTVYLSVGRYRWRPRRYRGRDAQWWSDRMGRLDRTVETREPAPPWAETGVRGGHALNLRRFAGNGVVLLGLLQAAQDGTITFASDLEENLTAADNYCAAWTKEVDEYVLRNGIDVPAERPEGQVKKGHPGVPITELNLRAAGIAAVIWATGFKQDFDWVHVPVFDDQGMVAHQRGVTLRQGLFFTAIERLYKVRSIFIYGVEEDAVYLATQIAAAGSS